jgi:hypothetical protein|tara:strand:- start:235 stop:1224 length:990 start_codon:yes stop_codon:yes gene_type:complete
MLELKNLQTTRNNLLNWVFQDKDGVLKDKPQFVFNMFVDHLEESYRSWYVSDANQRIDLCEFKKSDYENTELKTILEIHDELANTRTFSHFLIHGSCADLRIIPGWSDFDSIAVIRKESLYRKNRLKTFNMCRRIDKMMRSLDPYQHHGIHFIHEKDLRSFPDLYLPANLLADSKCLLGNANIEIQKVDSSDQETARFYGIVRTLKSATATGILQHHAKGGKFLLEDYADSDTMYQLKYLLCVVMLLPTLWLNLKGNYCQKSDSYEMIRSYFSSEQLEFLESCSNVRSSWNKSLHKGNKISSEVKKILGENYLARASKFAELLESSCES